MKTLLSLFALSAGFASLSCEPNEITFFVEHVKAFPDPPACSYSVSDDFIPGMLVDLSMHSGVSNAYLLKNALLSREDYDNLRAESNGIFAEGYEVAVNVAATNETIGGSNRYIQEYYLAPQSEDLMIAYTIPPDVVDDLADSFDCLEFSPENYPEDTVYGSGTDVRGNAVGRNLGTVFATIRFFGHTQGSVEVETQDFSFPIQLCCGCSVNWTNCIDRCDRYCGTVGQVKTCNLGVVSGTERVDCRSLYHAPETIWNGGCTNDVDEPVQCSCDICGK